LGKAILCACLAVLAFAACSGSDNGNASSASASSGDAWTGSSGSNGSGGPVSYTVIFDGNEADVAPDPAYILVTTHGALLEALPTPPIRVGYAFTGWNTDPEGGGAPFTLSTPVTGTIIVYAQWAPNVYTVAFNKNNTDAGGTDANPAEITVTVPAANVGALPAPPTRPGYIFINWIADPNGNGSAFEADTTVTASMEVWAQWALDAGHLVIFDGNGADVQANPLAKSVITPATTVGTLPTPPARTGYTFDGWNTAQGGGGTPFDENTTVTAGIRVWAQWMPDVYTVTFNKNNTDPGSTDANPATITVTVPAVNVGALPATEPTRPGYTFAGWSTAQGGGGSPFTATTQVTASIEVFAQWTVKSYTVTFNKNTTDAGSTDASPLTKTVTWPATTVGTLPATEPTRTGYTFAGWDTAQGGGGSAFTATTQVTEPITVYAQWTIKSYTITFNKNNTDEGSTDANPSTKTANHGATMSLPAEPTRSGYAFAGWDTAQGGGGSSFTATTPVTATITVWAQWAPNVYIVTFNKNNTDAGSTGANPATKTVTHPATTVDTLPAPPARDGYIFRSWNTAQNGSGSVFEANTAVTASIPVYAQWERDFSSAHVSLLSIAGKTTGSQEVRSAPSSGNTVTTLPSGSFVHIKKIDAVTKWLEVEYARDQHAFISFGSSTEAVLTSRVGQALQDKDVYADQSATTKLGVIRQGSFVLLIEKVSTWYKVLVDGTTPGYITATEIMVPKGVVTAVSPYSTTVPTADRYRAYIPQYNNVTGKRGPAAYSQIINLFNVGDNSFNSTSGNFTSSTYNARYNQIISTNGSPYTKTGNYCNIFGWDVMTAMTVHFPHWVVTSSQEPVVPPPGNGSSGGIPSNASSCSELTSNGMYTWMTNYGKTYGWTEVDPTIAQNRANNGFPTVTMGYSVSSGSGHIQIVRPEGGGGTSYSNTSGCAVAQAGAMNFNYGNVRVASVYQSAFHASLKYFTHDGITVGGVSGTHNQPEGAYTIDPSDPGWADVTH